MNSNGCQPQAHATNASLRESYLRGHLVEGFLRLNLCRLAADLGDTGARFIFYKSLAHEHKTKHACRLELAAKGRACTGQCRTPFRSSRTSRIRQFLVKPKAVSDRAPSESCGASGCAVHAQCVWRRSRREPERVFELPPGAQRTAQQQAGSELGRELWRFLLPDQGSVRTNQASTTASDQQACKGERDLVEGRKLRLDANHFHGSSRSDLRTGHFCSAFLALFHAHSGEEQCGRYAARHFALRSEAACRRGQSRRRWRRQRPHPDSGE